MLVSVIIPVYNAEKYISAAIKSVLSQTHQYLELIIVDDGSKDNTENIIKSFDDNRIKYIHQKNAGVAVARNNGIKHSKGEYIAFLDSDDTWKTEKLKVQLDKISSDDGICMVYSAFEMRYEDRHYTKFYRYNNNEDNFIEKLITDPFKSIPYPSSVMLKRSYLEQAGEFNPDFPTGEDWDLWLRLAALGKCTYIDEILVSKLTHSESITNSLSLKTTEEFHFRLLDNFFTNNPNYRKHKPKAYSMIYYDIACRHYGRNNHTPSKELYENLLRSFMAYPLLYLTKPKIQFAIRVLVKDKFHH